ncbi:MAG: TolC family protein [Lentisphaeraceae bacterium]|nr:TolC family protein [Lentisphaeraceae bacterium]
MKILLVQLTLFSTLIMTSCHTIIIPEDVIQNNLNAELSTEKNNFSKSELPNELSLYQAQQIALSENPSLEAAGFRIKRAQAIIDQAKSLYAPTADISSSARHFHYVGGNIFNFRNNPYESYSTSLNASWLVFDGFFRHHNLLSAKYGKIASQESLNDTKRLLVDAVSLAFYQTVLAQKQMAINLELREINHKFLEDTQTKLDAGVSTVTEVNNFKVRVNDSEIAHLESTNAYETAKLILVELLGSPDADTGNLKIIFKNFDFKIPKQETAIGIALNKRPDLKFLQAQILESKELIEVAKSEYYPSVFLEASYGFSSLDDLKLGDEEREAFYGVGLSWNIFTGLSTEALIFQRKSEINEKLESLKTKWNEIIREIRQQRYSLHTAKRKLEVQVKSVALTKSIYEDTKEIFDNGATTITRVNEVLTDYSIAQLNHILFKIEALKRKNTLDSLLGINIQ